MTYVANPDTRRRSIALISSWVHDEAAVPTELVNDPALSVDLALLAAAFLRCWANEAGIPPQVLLADIALGEALEQLKTSN